MGDPRYRSGEHRTDSETPEGMRAITTVEALGVELQSIRRENRMQFKHTDKRIDEIVFQCKDMLTSMQGGLTHCATHDVQIGGLDKRVGKLEAKEESDSQVAAAERRADRNDKGSPETQSALMAIVKSRTWPWALCTLLALAMILAAITGRSSDSIVPTYHTQSHGSATSAPPAVAPSP